MDRRICLIVHNIRSCHNVGAMLRTAEGLGVETVYMTGYTPYPHTHGDERLPHLSRKIHAQIQKTALGAESTQQWRQEHQITNIISELRAQDFTLAAVEQTANSSTLPDFSPPDRIALVLGREVEGLEDDVIAQCDVILEIPMFGQKESFNVTHAAAMSLYHCRFSN